MMENREFIPIDELCQVYEIDLIFFKSLSEYELIEIVVREEIHLIPVTAVSKLERIVRLYKDLNVNLEGVDVILNLLRKVDELELELIKTKNRLRLYEND